MPWPDEILTTYTTSSPIKPNDLVLMQQTIVGFRTGVVPMALPERSLGIAAMGFQHQSILPTPAPQGSETLWTLFTNILAPVPLWSGCRIKRVVYRAKRNSATGSANGSVVAYNDANDIGVNLDTTAIATTPGVGVMDNYTTPEINYVIQPGESVQLRIGQAANNSLQFARATVYFDVPLP